MPSIKPELIANNNNFNSSYAQVLDNAIENSQRLDPHLTQPSLINFMKFSLNRGSSDSSEILEKKPSGGISSSYKTLNDLLIANFNLTAVTTAANKNANNIESPQNMPSLLKTLLDQMHNQLSEEQSLALEDSDIFDQVISSITKALQITNLEDILSEKPDSLSYQLTHDNGAENSPGTPTNSPQNKPTATQPDKKEDKKEDKNTNSAVEEMVKVVRQELTEIIKPIIKEMLMAILPPPLDLAAGPIADAITKKIVDAIIQKIKPALEQAAQSKATTKAAAQPLNDTEPVDQDTNNSQISPPTNTPNI